VSLVCLDCKRFTRYKSKHQSRSTVKISRRYVGSRNRQHVSSTAGPAANRTRAPGTAGRSCRLRDWVPAPLASAYPYPTSCAPLLSAPCCVRPTPGGPAAGRRRRGYLSSALSAAAVGAAAHAYCPNPSPLDRVVYPCHGSVLVLVLVLVHPGIFSVVAPRLHWLSLRYSLPKAHPSTCGSVVKAGSVRGSGARGWDHGTSLASSRSLGDPPTRRGGCLKQSR
jgi:hypothetical protein